MNVVIGCDIIYNENTTIRNEAAIIFNTGGAVASLRSSRQPVFNVTIIRLGKGKEEKE